jgi:hypothetical protein
MELTVNEYRHILFIDYGLSDDQQDELFSLVCFDRGLIADFEDPELWEILFQHLPKTLTRPKSLTEQNKDRVVESRRFVAKREDIGDHVPYEERISKKHRSRSSFKGKTAIVANSSVADIDSDKVAAKQVLTAIGSSYLLNVDKKYSLIFKDSKAFLIDKKVKGFVPLLLGQWIELSPSYVFQSSPSLPLTIGEQIMITRVFKAIREDANEPKIMDLRVWLQIKGLSDDGLSQRITNEEKIESNQRIRLQFNAWLSERSNKSIDNFLSKARKRGINCSGAWLTNYEPNIDRIFQIWKQYEL